MQRKPLFGYWIGEDRSYIDKEVRIMDDSQIIELYFARDERAIGETATKYGSYCHSIAYRILASHPDSEEVVSDTYMGAWNAIPPVRPLCFSGFLGKITRRLALNRWRDSRAEKRGGGEPALALEELEGCIPDRSSVEAVLEKKDLSASIRRFVRELPKTEQRIFVLRYWHLYSIRDIAEKYHYSESKVKSMLSRTRQKLQKHLVKEGVL